MQNLIYFILDLKQCEILDEVVLFALHALQMTGRLQKQDEENYARSIEKDGDNQGGR